MIKCGKEEKGDLIVEIDFSSKNINQININSKYLELFKSEITKAINEILKKYDEIYFHLNIKDFGALNFVIKARIECAVEKLLRGAK